MATSPAKKAIDANRGKMAPFVTNQVTLHNHQPQKIDGKTYNFSSSQIPNLDQHVATMTIPLQVSVPASFFASSSNYYSFKMQAGHYSCKNLALEMDLTNTLAATVQLVPAPLLVNYVRITTGSGAILKPHQWKFLNTAHQTQLLTMTAANVYPIQLVLLNGLVLFVWFILRQSVTSAGLTTGTQITNFEWRDLHNTNLQNGVLTRDAIAWYEYGTREFDSVFFQNNYAYPTCWVPYDRHPP